MMRKRCARAAGLLLVTLSATACTGPLAGPNSSATPSPSAKVAPQPQLPNFNSRLGSNRVAAVVGARMGRQLYTRGQYWEVFVRTTPIVLPGTYDPAHPERSAAEAATVTGADIIMATESAAAIKAFQQTGVEQEKVELGDLEVLLRKTFPNATTTTIRVFFGESFQYATAMFDHGKLVRYDARKTG